MAAEAQHHCLLPSPQPRLRNSACLNVGLLALREEGTIERISRGIHHHTDAQIADFDLIEIAIKAPKATLFLTSALAQHDLTDTIPSAIDIALPRGEWQPITLAQVRWHKFALAIFDLGRTALRIDSEHEIGLYDAMRTIVDAFRPRYILGDDMAYGALRRWLRQRGQSSELMAMAQQFPKAFAAILQASRLLR